MKIFPLRERDAHVDKKFNYTCNKFTVKQSCKQLESKWTQK